MSNKANLHRQIDAEYGGVIDSLPEAFSFYMVPAVFDMWFREKAYADRYGYRMPVIVNIKSLD